MLTVYLVKRCEQCEICVINKQMSTDFLICLPNSEIKYKTADGLMLHTFVSLSNDSTINEYQIASRQSNDWSNFTKQASSDLDR